MTTTATSKLGRVGILSAAALALVAVASLLATGCKQKAAAPEPVAPPATPARIISLSPSITETVYAVGAGDLLCGVTDYCNYPPAATERPRIGGYFQPNYERIVALQPDCILVLPEHLKSGSNLEKLGVPLIAVGNQQVADVLAGILRVGELCQRREAAAKLHGELLARLAALRENRVANNAPRALVCIGRGSGRGAIAEVYAAGDGSIHDEWLTLAGGVNAVTAANYPMIGTETILRLNPELIVELSAKPLSDAEQAARIADWQALSEVAAVHNNRIRVLSGSHLMIPGPRFLDAVETIAAAVAETTDD